MMPPSYHQKSLDGQLILKRRNSKVFVTALLFQLRDQIHQRLHVARHGADAYHNFIKPDGIPALVELVADLGTSVN